MPDQDANGLMRSRLVHQGTGAIHAFSVNGKTNMDFYKLTSREQEVLYSISEGYSSKQIADKFNISVHTVNTHRQNIIEKMNVSNTTEAVRLASIMGMMNG